MILGHVSRVLTGLASAKKNALKGHAVETPKWVIRGLHAGPSQLNFVKLILHNYTMFEVSHFVHRIDAEHTGAHAGNISGAIVAFAIVLLYYSGILGGSSISTLCFATAAFLLVRVAAEHANGLRWDRCEAARNAHMRAGLTYHEAFDNVRATH
jgi:hypothetical protein